MDSRTDRLYRLVELLPSLPIWGGSEALPLERDGPLPVDQKLNRPELPNQTLAKTGLNRMELELLFEADRWSSPMQLPAELFPQERWLKDRERPPAWWRLSLPVIGPLGTLVCIELCTSQRTYPMHFFSPRIGPLQRLD